MKKGQVKIDEFAFVLLAGIIMIATLMIVWSTPTEPVPVVQPSSVSLTMEKGAIRSFDLEISAKNPITNITLSASGEIGSWITFGKKEIEFIKKSDKVNVRVNVPKTALEKKYSGKILLKSTGGERSVPVEIEIVNISTIGLTSRSIQLGDVSIRSAVSSKVLDSKENIEVSKGYFSESFANLAGNLNEKELSLVTDGYVQLEVEYMNGLNNLIVSLNGAELLNRKVGVGELTIPIDKSMIKNSNTITIQAGTPGAMFWASTVYKLKVVKIVVNLQDTSSKEINFNLDRSEISNFNNFQLSAILKDYSRPIEELKVAINGQVVYLEKPPITAINTTFSKDIFGTSLFLDQTNTIRFSIEKEASFELGNVVLTVFSKV